VAATSKAWRRSQPAAFFCSMLLLSVAVPTSATTLPDERADLMFHYYSGGGVTVSGPALLVRKNVTPQTSVSADVYTDSISSASVDVVNTASPYTDTRAEVGVGTHYLYGDSLLDIGYRFSDESDYTAKTLHMNVTQDFLGNTTTLNLGFSRGWDQVGRVDNAFSADADHFQFRAGLSQVLSPNWVAALDYEAIGDRGYLQNPYRYARALGTYYNQIYPTTRTSNAIALRSIKSLFSNGAARAEYRYYWDNWNIQAHTLELAYRHKIDGRFSGEARYRFYTQSAASFYSDNFDREYNYMSRDKELSQFHDHSVGVNLSFVVLPERAKHWISKSTVELGYDYIMFRYDDFTDLGSGNLYQFNAHVLRLTLSIWY